MTQTITFKIIGITDETTVCECCGKSNLKKVVVMENIDTGEIVRYGVDCAARARGNGNKFNTKEAKKAIDFEYEMRVMVKRWMDKGLSAENVVIALGNRGYGAELRNGAIKVRGLSAPITL